MCTVTTGQITTLFSKYADFREWAELQRLLSEKIVECTGARAASEAPYLVTLVRPGETVSVVVPQNERYSPNLPGGPKSVFVLVLVDRHADDETTIRDFRLVSATVPNDLVTQLPDVATTVIGPIAGGLLPPSSGQWRLLERMSDALPPPLSPPMPEAVAFASTEPVILPSSNLSISQTGTLSLVKSDGKAEDVKIVATFTNKTKRRAVFTAVAGALIGPVHGDEKMKVSDDKYASDPIARGLTMAAIAIHPTPYDATLSEMSPAERLSFLLGGVLTPAPGFGAGLSIGITRGFGLNIGGAVMFVPTSQEGLKPKQPVPEGNNQLRYGWTGGLFSGISYVFKGN